MPELPEVEVTRQRIEGLFVGRQVKRVHTTEPSYFFITPPKELARRLTGRTPTALIRHGKYLLLELDDDSRLLLHLGMTGQLFGEGAESVRLLSKSARGQWNDPLTARSIRADKHLHLVLEFEDGGPQVLFRDTRKFGKVLWLAAGETDARLTRLGVDALEAEPRSIQAKVRQRRAPIKATLLDQGVLAGVGNIYADEALFLARIRPTRDTSRLTASDWERLIQAVKWVLRRSIETGGSSISDYVLPDGSDGAYQDERRVYARTGLPCLECGALIQRIQVGQRSTHFCAVCQRR
ncbi:MAG: bifunctional DNA-formamidopyrimidine glycosylase/DNA-(apurinic or apyrimidinic site) lyase [Polyangiaceae bacterium]|nr:bifunctional DNA-formamidopyrimidine glycosylase/DNA-(apurinic or apyrimidinic site) lyase [Polyangiaceae bacterium]MCW5788824.1 bifunctional DNA-formamidopyrimidine glycosylase/DNA-(apurinic or apyrimidinic site) lyase [Polyangiaceae bacterium]